jgi:hypothetical protein
MATEQLTPPVPGALEVVKSAPLVSMRELPDGGLAFPIRAPKRKRRDIWAVPALMFALGVACVVAAYLLRLNNPGLPPGYVWRAPVMLTVVGFLNIAFGPTLFLILLTQGPPRDVELEARRGTLKADRSVAGDRVVSTYGADEIMWLFVEGSVLFATTGKGDQQLLAFGDGKLNRAIMTLLGDRLWRGEEWVLAEAPGRTLCMPEKHATIGAGDE